MRNDTIDFIFSNGHDREVLLNPHAIAELAEALEALFSAFLKGAGVRAEKRPVTVYLVALHRGSTIVSFLADLAPGLLSEIKGTPLSALNNAFGILEHLSAIALAATVHFKLAKPERPDARIPSDQALMEQLGNRLLAGSSIRRQVEAVTALAMEAGAETVALRVPGEPVVILSQEGSSDPRLIGSAATTPSPTGNFDGEIRVGSDTLETLFSSVAGGDTKVQLHNGLVKINNVEVPIVLQWGSKREVPEPHPPAEFSEPVHVKGSFTPAQAVFNTPENSRNRVEVDGSEMIPGSFRDAAAFLIVNSQVLEE